ncbi:iron-sulfur cluster assembly scaffold protein [Salinisphaera sp. SPP-AMP-43]|uniref:iron-sulfur cluster assembly scaffold protein n=1 Tax=Salinisphaera sp. SPP-AMP-43 TaxID=3121288 RepID=UPI003C6DDE63
MDEVTTRFLQPAYAVGNVDDWPASGFGETPGADARCRIFLAIADDERLRAAFGAFGPPPVIAAADWTCQRVTGETIENARSLSVRELERALALSPTQRYAGALAIDALANAMINLGR